MKNCCSCKKDSSSVLYIDKQKKLPEGSLATIAVGLQQWPWLHCTGMQQDYAKQQCQPLPTFLWRQKTCVMKLCLGHRALHDICRYGIIPTARDEKRDTAPEKHSQVGSQLHRDSSSRCSGGRGPRVVIDLPAKMSCKIYLGYVRGQKRSTGESPQGKRKWRGSTAPPSPTLRQKHFYNSRRTLHSIRSERRTR